MNPSPQQPAPLTKLQHLHLQMLGAFVTITFDQAVAEVRTAPGNKQFAAGLTEAQGLLASVESQVGQEATHEARCAVLDAIAVKPVSDWPETVLQLARAAGSATPAAGNRAARRAR